MFASASRKLSKNPLRGKKMQESYVLTIVQLVNQLKNAISCITQDYPDLSGDFFQKVHFSNFHNIKGNSENKDSVLFSQICWKTMGNPR